MLIHHGTGEFTAPSPAPVQSPPPSPPSSDEPRLNITFDNAPVTVVVQSLLGDVAHYSVVIDPTVTGTITIRSQGQLTAPDLPSFLKAALGEMGLELIDQGANHYVLQPARRDVGATMAPSVYRPGVEYRGGMVIMGLKYVSATEMTRLLQPLARNNASVSADPTREILFLNGPPDAVQNMVQTVQLLDVDWLAGMSFAIVPLDYSDPDTVIDEVRRLFGGANGPIGDMIDFVPLKGRHAIMVLAKRPDRLDQARTWIAQLDRPLGGHAGQIRVIALRNADATTLADTVKRLFNGGAGAAETGAGGNASSGGGGPASLGAASAPAAFSSSGSAGAGVEITADATHNALLVQADPATFEDIRATVEQLDAPVDQVAIEVTIAEVTLNHDFSFGVQWQVNPGGGVGVVLSNSSTATPASVFPGFSATFNRGDVQATLNTLSTKTKVEVISSPILLTLNNKEADLQVGDQVPTISQSAANLTSPSATIVNSVSYQSTGILLKVTPRIGAGGSVTLEVNQEDSDVAQTTTSGIDSPTIEQRTFHSTVSVPDGQTVVLGGLISATKSHSRSGIPIVSQIPLLGEAFSSRKDSDDRTELLVFLTPKIVRSPADAALLTDDLEKRLGDIRASKFIQNALPKH